jgi:hypothetical protein
MPKSRNINTWSYLVDNEFAGIQSPYLRVWNILSTAINLIEIGGDSLAERYLSINLKPEDTQYAHVLAPKIMALRTEHYGLYAGQSIPRNHLGVQLRTQEWI